MALVAKGLKPSLARKALSRRYRQMGAHERETAVFEKFRRPSISRGKFLATRKDYVLCLGMDMDVSMGGDYGYGNLLHN